MGSSQSTSANSLDDHLNAHQNRGNEYREQGRLREAEQMYMLALERRERVLGADHQATVDSVHSLGCVYRDQRRLGEAQDMFTLVLASREKELGADHISTLDTVNNLGVIYCQQG